MTYDCGKNCAPINIYEICIENKSIILCTHSDSICTLFWTHHIFLHDLYLILSRGISISVFVEESCCGVCKCKYSYCVATWHSAVITWLLHVKLCSEKEYSHTVHTTTVRYDFIFGKKKCVNYVSEYDNSKFLCHTLRLLKGCASWKSSCLSTKWEIFQ
jgi:hypothetical protein